MIAVVVLTETLNINWSWRLAGHSSDGSLSGKTFDSDLAELVRVVNGAYRGETGRKGWTTEAHLLDGQRTDPEMLRAALENERSRILIAFPASQEDRSNSIIDEPVRVGGCVNVEKRDEDTCYLGMLTVDVDFQKRGLGDYLLKIAEDFARREFSAECMIMTVLKQRPELLEWYYRRGYIDTGKREPFPYGDERFGKPLIADLEFKVLEKNLHLKK